MNALNNSYKNESDIDLIEYFRNQPEFASFLNDELKMLEKIMLVRHYPDSYTFKSSENIYLMIEGNVTAKYTKDNDIIKFNNINPAQFFGLFSLINNIQQPVKYVSLGGVIAASLPRIAFELLLNSKLPLAGKLRHIINVNSKPSQEYENEIVKSNPFHKCKRNKNYFFNTFKASPLM